MAERRIPATDDHQLELLTELQERRIIRAHRQEAVRDEANSLMRVVCMIVGRSADDHQGLSHHLTWISELHMRALFVEMFTILAEEEMDGGLEADIWRQVSAYTV